MITGEPKRASLSTILPEGQLVDRGWLESHGFKRPDVDYYLRSGNLQPVSHGLYRRIGDVLKWQHVVYSLQELGRNIHIGGHATLVEGGFDHYVKMTNKTVDLFSAENLPKWVDTWKEKNGSDYGFRTYKRSWLKDTPKELITTRPFGGWDWLIKYAQPELAILEFISTAKTETDLSVIDPVFENLATLSPSRMQLALEFTKHVKTKRLFGWFCDRHSHVWSKKIEWQNVHTGKGKISFIKGGKFNKKWRITVPVLMELETQQGGEHGSDESLF